MLKGFKDFIMRGNIIELAIAVVIGTAFTALVKAFTDAIIQPIINVFAGGSVTGLSFYLNSKNPKTLVDFGAILTAGITFLITAAVVYFVFVLPLNKLAERRKRGEVPAPATPTELELLIEIRDLLAAGNTTGAASGINKI
jgi:large conductance mechanosensitive channel